ncbi:Crp/Fnr family transcriptional regulator [Bacillus sp. DNRA2]|uniref:Crp/Fnr family transcriptional regulator n=1 Tax=Bacillus sp. DNRA2 TaxID=2723053 RepID=UPI00145F34FB|nr:Crp/Fnr family transcriptional regulator [Bacillus sp. DNRA2]NMD68676.1 Crp/Fnr family transcriptional regulator [Bacillus sp. DNRA2]
MECNGAHNHFRCHHHGDDSSSKLCVSLVPIFDHLEVEQMKEVMATAKSISYKRGEMVYHAGNQSASLYIVNKGKIKIYRLSEAGKEQVVRILNPGDFTGELALFNETIHESYAEAIEETEVCRIERTDLHEFLLKYPSISLKILAEFSNRLELSEKQATRFATEKAETRIALFLAECIDSDSQSKEFVLPMSRKNLASYLGTTPETLSRKLYDLEEMGYINQKKRKRIEILDLEGLLSV